MTAVRDDMTVRAVRYEIVPTDRAVSLGLSPDAIDRFIGQRSQVAVLWCTDQEGRRLTAVGDVTHLLEVLVSGMARHPAGIRLAAAAFPVVLSG